jgi:cbb3-type cytochrome oxidase subunit 3
MGTKSHGIFLRENMNGQAAAYVIFGLTLVVLFIVIIVYYYSKKRHGKVEEPKYSMFDDED